MNLIPNLNSHTKRKNLFIIFLESGGAKKSKGNVYSMHLNNLMELTTKDPDPYFFGSYNWYYTGGSLETASIYDVDFLFYATGEKLNIFSKIHKHFPMFIVFFCVSFIRNV